MDNIYLLLLILVILCWIIYELLLKFKRKVAKIKKDYKELKKIKKELDDIFKKEE